MGIPGKSITGGVDMNTKCLFMDLEFIKSVEHYGDIVFDNQFQTGSGFCIRQTMYCYEGEQYLKIMTDGDVRAFFKLKQEQPV